MRATEKNSMDRIAVLASGGIDSSILLADLARDSVVFPIYVSMGLVWEEAEKRALQLFMDALKNPKVRSLTSLSVPIDPFSIDPWAITGQDVPGMDSEDSEVFLPGRNIFLIGLTSVWCKTHDVSKIAIGSLGGNPFPDATAEFFSNFSKVLSEGLACDLEVIAPYRGLHKEDIMHENRELPLELTLTCLAPKDGIHCGNCNKCNERQIAFAKAGMEDKTLYGQMVKRD